MHSPIFAALAHLCTMAKNMFEHIGKCSLRKGSSVRAKIIQMVGDKTVQNNVDLEIFGVSITEAYIYDVKHTETEFSTMKKTMHKGLHLFA